MSEPMRRAVTVLITLLAAITLPTPTLADSQMKQSPLLMRRAGPSCQPGNLEGEPGAGYAYRLGPCAGVDSSSPAGGDDGQERPARRRRFR